MLQYYYEQYTLIFPNGKEYCYTGYDIEEEQEDYEKTYSLKSIDEYHKWKAEKGLLFGVFMEYNLFRTKVRCYSEGYDKICTMALDSFQIIVIERKLKMKWSINDVLDWYDGEIACKFLNERNIKIN